MATPDMYDFLTKDPVDTYVPVPFPATYPRHNQDPAPAPGGDTGGGTPSTGSGAVYAAALFLNAYCLAADKVGAWVRVTDAVSTVATTTSGLSYPAIGIIVSKTSDTSCVVQTYGLCAGVYSGLTPNLRLFVGPTGRATPGSALPSGTAYVQPIGFSVRSDTIFVQPSGVLFRRDATPDQADPAPAPSGDSTSAYRPVLHGEDAPDNGIGQLGDVYIATGPLLLFTRLADGWDQGKPFGQATSGQQGEPGKDGSVIVRVTSLPQDASPYRLGDFLIDDDGNAASVVNA